MDKKYFNLIFIKKGDRSQVATARAGRSGVGLKVGAHRIIKAVWCSNGESGGLKIFERGKR